ncbi:MAG: sialidase family protein, partial [bacterium]|nr:sialidase family protein [bacterium]
MLRLTTWTLAALLAAVSLARAADPVFENRTPVGFNPGDSTIVQDFVSGNDVSIRVDLNQAATYEYPVIGHFHAVERSEQLSATDTDGLQIDIAIVDVAPFSTSDNIPLPGVTQFLSTAPEIHMAWIEQSIYTIGQAPLPFTAGTTAAYEVFYANSSDGGASFSTPVSVSNGISYYLITADGAGTAFSTLDLEVDSGGNPRVVYAFVTTADHTHDNNVYFGYSIDGGTTWQPPLILNDRTTVGNTEGRRTAFPRMAIDDRDRIFVSYVRGTTLAGTTDDVMLAKIDHHVSPFAQVPIGSLGTVGSSGGIRLTDDAQRHTGPDLAVGDGDVLHVVYFNDDLDRIEHKRLSTDTTWVDVSASGWDQGSNGAIVASFDDEAATNAVLNRDATFYFPTVAIDRLRLPDRAFAVYKYGAGPLAETIGYNQYDDDGSTGPNAIWGTAQAVWSTGATPLFTDAGVSDNHEIELDWTITERVAAVVDERLDDRGDLHIAFTAGHSTGGEHDVYFATYNGTTWTLPEKVADDDSDGAGIEDGIAATDTYLLSPALATHRDFESLFLAFGAGTAEGFGVR